MIDICNELQTIFKSKRFTRNFNNIKNNWLELPIEKAMKNILEYLNNLVVEVVF